MTHNARNSASGDSLCHASTSHRLASAESIDTESGAYASREVSTQRNQKIFSAIAKDYSLFNYVASCGMCAVWLKRFVRMCEIREHEHILDLAGGTGDVSCAIARRYPTAHILLSDINPSMLEVARMRIAKNPKIYKRVSCKIVDAQAIDLPDASVDLVTMAYGIRNMPLREQALREIERVLTSKGRFACLEFSYPTLPVLRTLYRWYSRYILPLLSCFFSHNTASIRYLTRTIEAFPPPAHFAEIIKDAGFTRVNYTCLNFGVVCIYLAYKN